MALGNSNTAANQGAAVYCDGGGTAEYGTVSGETFTKSEDIDTSGSGDKTITVSGDTAVYE